MYLYYRSKKRKSIAATSASNTLLSKLAGVGNTEEDTEEWLFRVLEESSTEVKTADMASVGHVIEV